MNKIKFSQTATNAPATPWPQQVNPYAPVCLLKKISLSIQEGAIHLKQTLFWIPAELN